MDMPKINGNPQNPKTLPKYFLAIPVKTTNSVAPFLGCND